MRRAWLILVLVGAAALAAAAPAPGRLTGHERAQLYGIAQDTWRFYANDVDPATQLPMDNLGPGTTQGTYTSAANIGVYLWAVVAARDLHLISTEHAAALAGATLTEVQALKRFHGLLYQWYDTRTGAVLLNPGQPDCTETTPAQDNCWFLSAVDNGWYASGLIEVRQALPALRDQADALLAPMDFSLFYDARAQTSCNTNAALPGNPPTGQMYGGYYVGQGPAGYHNGALYSDPRIAIYMGMGRHQMPGDVGGVRGAPSRRSSAPATRTSPAKVSGRRPATGRRTPTRSRTAASACGRATTSTPTPTCASSRPSPAECSRR